MSDAAGLHCGAHPNALLRSDFGGVILSPWKYWNCRAWNSYFQGPLTLTSSLNCYIYIYTLYLWYICACLCFCILFYLHTVEIVLFRLYVCKLLYIQKVKVRISKLCSASHYLPACWISGGFFVASQFQVLVNRSAPSWLLLALLCSTLCWASQHPSGQLLDNLFPRIFFKGQTIRAKFGVPAKDT